MPVNKRFKISVVLQLVFILSSLGDSRNDVREIGIKFHADSEYATVLPKQPDVVK